MKIFSSLFLLTLTSTTLICCQKDSEQATTTTPTDYLTASAWVHESSGLDQNLDGTIDFPLPAGTLPTCRLDNVLTFKKDNTATADEGATKCNDADQQTTTFNWSFADSEKSLVISNNVFTALNGKLKIIALDNNKLSVSKDTTFLGTPVAIVVNLKH